MAVIVRSLIREQLHDIGHLAKAVTLAMAWHAMARHTMSWLGMPPHGTTYHAMLGKAWNGMP